MSTEVRTGTLLFLLFINELHKGIINSSEHHFADNTNLLLAEKSLNFRKTEVIVLKNKKQEITKPLNFRISGQKIIPTMRLKSLVVLVNGSLSWYTHFITLITKLNIVIGLYAKI